MQKRLVLLLVLVCIVFLWINRSSITEGFKAPTKKVTSPPITSEFVKKLYDDIIITAVNEYQALSQMKTDDVRVKNNMKLLAVNINDFNMNYPATVEFIKGYNFANLSMITEEDLTIIKDFIVRTAGQVDPKKPLEPVSGPELDLFVNRLQALVLYVKNRVKFFSSDLKVFLDALITELDPMVNDVIKNTQEFKKQIGTMKPTQISVLKRLHYPFMIMLSQVKYVWPPDTDNIPTGPIQTDNLPLPKLSLTEINTTLEATNIVNELPKSVTEPPPPPEPCPIPPEGKKYSETVRDLLIENALVKAYGGTYLY